MKIVNYKYLTISMFIIFCSLNMIKSKVNQNNFDVNYIKPLIVDDLKNRDYYAEIEINKNKEVENRINKNNDDKVLPAKKESEIKEKEVNEAKKSLEKKIIDLESKIKLAKIDLFGDENASLDYYKKHSHIYNRDFLKKVELVVDLMESVDEYNFIKSKQVNTSGSALIKDQKAIRSDSDDKFAFRKSKPEEPTKRLLRTSDDKTKNNVSAGLNVNPPDSKQSYKPLFLHDTVKEKNLIVKSNE